MNIYLAASWSQRKLMRDVYDHLASLDIGVTSHWIFSDDPKGMGPDDVARDPDKAIKGASRDLLDINTADLVAVFTYAPSTTGGFHVEFGYALSRAKPVDIIGPSPNVFYSLDMPEVRHFDNTVDWFDQLQKDKEN